MRGVRSSGISSRAGSQSTDSEPLRNGSSLRVMYLSVAVTCLMRSSQELYDIPIYTYLCYIVSYRLSGFFSGTSSSSVVCSSRLIIAVARSLDRNTDAPRRHSLLRVTRAVLGARHAKANTGFRHRHHRHHLVGLVASASRWLVRHCSGDTLLPTEANK